MPTSRIDLLTLKIFVLKTKNHKNPLIDLLKLKNYFPETQNKRETYKDLLLPV